MVIVTSLSTSERYKEMDDKWLEFRVLYYGTSLTKQEILKKLDVSLNSEVYKFIQKNLRDESVSPHSRAKLIKYGNWLS